MTADSRVASELQTEQAYVDSVMAELARASKSAKNLEKESKARFTSTRETWIREEDSTALFERDAFAYIAARRLADLEGQHEGLVFGRLDFVDTEKRYVGRLGVRTADFEPLVIDWRASAAEPFYRATPVHPMDVVRRRVLSSRDDKVTGIEDDVLMPTSVPADMVVIGDGALMQALGRARGPKMHDIVATIQAEQDEAIRAPYAGVTVIAGGPGTGKTVVGLHRIAFLLYSHRRRFTNGGVLVVGPSPIFMDYIEKVLPSLGEDAVTLRSAGHVADDVLGFGADIRDDEAAWVIKGSARMRKLLQRLVEYSPVTQGLTVIVEGEPVTIPAAQLATIRRAVLAKSTYNQGRKIAEREVISFLRSQGEELVDTDDPRFEDNVRSFWSFDTYLDQWWPILEPGEVLAQLRDPNLIATLGGLTEDEAATLSSAINPQQWTVGDIPLLDELALLLGPVPLDEHAEPEPTPASSAVTEIVTISDRLTARRELQMGKPHTTYAHVLVDEAQDLTPMQWQMIQRRGPAASWTVLGDPAQSSWPNRDEPAKALQQLIGNKPHRRFTLSTNYRSPKEAYDLATSYIRVHEPDADIPASVRATGEAPRLLVAARDNLSAAINQQLARLLTDVAGTIGVIAPTQMINQLTDQAPDDPRITVLDPMTSKGLEFDAVIVVDPDAIAANTAAGARTLYVALTRATQILTTIDIDSPGAWRPETAISDLAA